MSRRMKLLGIKPGEVFDPMAPVGVKEESAHKSETKDATRPRESTRTGSYTEHKLIRAPRSGRVCHVLSFDVGHNVNVELLDAPVRLSREADPEDMTSVAAPASGAGSQFGKQQKDAVKARRRQRWLDRQGPQPKLPLHIEDNGGHHFVGHDQGEQDGAKSFYLFATAGSDGFQVVPTSKYYRVVQHRSLPKLSTEEAEEQMEARASVREVQRTLLMKQSVENGSTAKATRHLLSGGLRIMDSGSTIRGDDAAASGIHSDAHEIAKRARLKARQRTDYEAAEADEIDIDNQKEDFEVMSSDEEVAAVGDRSVAEGWKAELSDSSEDESGPSDKEQEDEFDDVTFDPDNDPRLDPTTNDNSSTKQVPEQKHERYVRKKELEEIESRKRKKHLESTTRDGKRIRLTKGLSDEEANKLEADIVKYLSRNPMTAKQLLNKCKIKREPNPSKKKQLIAYMGELLKALAERKEDLQQKGTFLFHLLEEYKVDN